MWRLSEAELNCVSTKMRLQAGVQAVADRDVDQPVFAADRHRRLRAHVGEREQPGAAAAAQNQGQHVVHRGILLWPSRGRGFTHKSFLLGHLTAVSPLFL